MEEVPKKKLAFVEKQDSESEEEEVIEINDSEEESENEEDDEDFDEDEDEINIADLMQTFFAGENGKNLVDTLDGLKKSVDAQNKILMKIGGMMEKYFSNNTVA